MPTSERHSGTVTFLFTDIEGSTALLKRLGRERYGELLARHRVLLREAFVAHRGEEIETQGDQFFGNNRTLDFASRRVGNYQWSQQTGTPRFDLLWVR